MPKNTQEMKNIKAFLLIEKMEKQLLHWSKWQLSLLGKIQIYKTFDLSQLYIT